MGVFVGELDALDKVDVDAPIRGRAHTWPLFHSNSFAEFAKQAQLDGRINEENVYRFLDRVVNVMPTFHRKEQPYSPYFSSNTHRSEVPSDFSPTDIAAIRKTITRTKDIALLAHLHDMLFVGPSRYHRAGVLAVPLFLDIARILHGTKNTTYIKDVLQRGIQLARQLGWRNTLGDSARSTLSELLRASAEEPFDSELLSCLRLAHEESVGDPKEWLRLAQNAGEYHKAKLHYSNTQDYFKMVLAFTQTTSNLEGERSAWREIGWSLERQAEVRTSQENPSYMAATSILKEAIQAYRRGKVDKDHIDALLERLRDYQSHSTSELGSFGRDFDATDQVNAVREDIKGQSLRTALLRLSFITKLTDTVQMKERVLANAKQFPMLYLLTTRILDDEGRDRQVQRGILDLDGSEFDRALKQRMFADVQFDWNYRAQVAIDPARRQFMEEHAPRPEDLHPLVGNNPFVPPGHEGLILRGLLAGLYGDFVLAAHLLVPQFENSVRHVLESAGVHVANILEDGTEPLKVWGGILDIPETLEIFGADRIFELEGLLVSESGFGFRNKLAHGMLTEAQCAASIPTINVWWLMLRLCMEQVAHRFDDVEQTKEGA